MTAPRTTTLDRLEPGDSATIVALDPSLPETERRRLMEMGFYSGTPVEVVRRSPLGDPVAYLIRGTTFALRQDQARYIEVHRDR